MGSVGVELGGWFLASGCYDFDGLCCHENSHDANHRSQYASCRTIDHTVGRRRSGKHAAVAESAVFAARHAGWVVEHHQLPFCAERRRGYEGFAGYDCRIGDEVPRGGVVRTVEDEVILVDYLQRVMRF